MNLEEAWELIQRATHGGGERASREALGQLVAGELGGDERALIDLYTPLLDPERTAGFVVGHLGQSLDGHIATESGHSVHVTGPENITHLHRMRSLSDAVVVGARTVLLDDPRLTTRRVNGRSPVRVVLDPRRRVGPDHQVFTDGAAPTLLVCRASNAGAGPDRIGDAEVVPIPGEPQGLDLSALLAELRRRGIRNVFVEGGGITVSAFLAAGLLDRLHIAIAPLLIGSGRPGINLPAIATLAEGIRPRHRTYRMGDDTLFDCDLRASSAGGRRHCPEQRRAPAGASAP